MNEFLILTIVALLSGTLLTLKSIYLNDYGTLGSAISRFCLSLVAGLMVVNIATMEVLFWAVIVTLVGDIINFIMYALTYKLKQKSDQLKTNKKIEEVSNKLFHVLENSSMAWFTINLDGEVEYVNKAFSDLLGLDKCSLVGRNFYALFSLDRLQFETELETILIYKNRRYTVKGYRTKNGHDTITGSIS